MSPNCDLVFDLAHNGIKLLSDAFLHNPQGTKVCKFLKNEVKICSLRTTTEKEVYFTISLWPSPTNEHTNQYLGTTHPDPLSNSFTSTSEDNLSFQLYFWTNIPRASLITHGMTVKTDEHL